MVAIAIVPFLDNILNASAEESNTNFQVNVKEALSVAITKTSVAATGNINEFLRNQINVSVTSNNANGFTASMTTKFNSTALENTTSHSLTMPTLGSNVTCTSSTCDAFPANYWGYSLNDASNTGTYKPMVGYDSSTPITILSSTSASSGSQDVYFGAKADANTASGTYFGTVVINVVTGNIDNTNPATPTDPAKPGASDQVAEYNAGVGTGTSTAAGTTTYSYTSGSTRTTQVSEGDNTGVYEGYTPPQGVTTNSSISTGSSLATGLAVTAASATASGLFFFILAKRKEDEEEEEEENQQ